MSTQEFNTMIICGALLLVCFFGLGLIVYDNMKQRKEHNV